MDRTRGWASWVLYKVAFISDCLRRQQNRVFDIAIVFTAFLGAAHILVRTSNYGLELDQDTWDFISTAESLAAGDGFTDYLWRPYVGSGPVYPMVLALFGVLGIDPIDTGRFVNIVGFGLIILLTGYQLSRHIRFRFLSVVGSAAVMASYSVTNISTYLMSDTLHVLFILLALTQIWKFLTSKNSPYSTLVLSAGFTVLATLTRYVGIAVMLAGACVILMRRNSGYLMKLKHTTIYGGISAILVAIWMIRERLTAGTFYSYEPTNSSTLEYIEHLSDLLVRYILVIYPGIDWIIYLLCAVICLFFGTKYRADRGQFRVPPSPDNSRFGLTFSLFGLFSLITFLIILTLASNLADAYKLPDRLLVSIYVPVIIIALVLIDTLLDRLVRKWTVPEFGLVCLILTSLIGSVTFSLRWNMDKTAQVLRRSAPQFFEIYGYSHHMEIWTYLRDNPIDGQVYSNGNHLLYWFTDVNLGGIISTADYGQDDCVWWVRSLADRRNQYIVYFTIERIDFNLHQREFDIRSPSFNFCNILELESDPYIENVLERMVETPEGIIYRLNPPSELNLLPGPPPNLNVQVTTTNTLIYTREDCKPDDTEQYFFLHIIPVDMNSLPVHRRPLGFDNLDFHFFDNLDFHFIQYGGNRKCTITIELPHYNISKIRTGQKTEQGAKVWETELSVR